MDKALQPIFLFHLTQSQWFSVNINKKSCIMVKKFPSKLALSIDIRIPKHQILSDRIRGSQYFHGRDWNNAHTWALVDNTWFFYVQIPQRNMIKSSTKWMSMNLLLKIVYRQIKLKSDVHKETNVRTYWLAKSSSWLWS